MLSRGSVMCGEIIRAVCRWIVKASKVSGRYLQRQARNVFFFRFDIFTFLQQNKGKIPPTCCQLDDINKTKKIPK